MRCKVLKRCADRLLSTQCLADTHGSLLAGVAIALCFVTGPAPAQRPASEQSVNQQMSSVRKLVNDSSAAMQVERINAPEALELQRQARGLIERASAASAAGDLEQASRLLKEASRQMFQAIRLSAPQDVDAQKKINDLDKRIASATSLNEALSRVIEEKKAGEQARRTVESVSALLARSQRERDQGDLAGALNSAESAYLGAKAALASLRSGDTLVRSLHFETPQDEYRYEIDRNDTHRMLVDVLLKERRHAQSVDQMVSRLVTQAADVRGQAEAQATAKQYDAGIKLLEQSTRLLVKAIRGAGVYIPG